MYLSKTNQEQYSHRNTHKQKQLASIDMHKNLPPPYILLFRICALQRGCFYLYHLHLFPNEVSQECNEPKMSVPISCCKSEIWNPLYETSERLSAKLVTVDLTNPSQKFHQRIQYEKIGGVDFEFMWNLLSPKKECVFTVMCKYEPPEKYQSASLSNH